ncbi:lipopolysaccharide biosynthesis protein [Actinoplanes sp. NPDC020271]|uniref:lipopolysaccharide biosynthesis protein n=1 Tax=Actinoplanes sp. NPDC020271 TaxID=3363896 RepID=UPI00378AE818
MLAGDLPGLRTLLRAVPAAVRRDYVSTLAVQWFVLGTGLYLFHLVAQRGSVEGFAYYQIARGTVSTFQPALLLGLGLGLQRYLPRTEHTTRRLARHALYVETVLVTVVGLVGVSAGTQIAGGLGLTGGREAVIAIVVMLGGNCLCSAGLAALRGNHQILDSNLIYGLGLGLIPLVAFLSAETIEEFLIIQGAGATAVGLWGTLVVRRRPATTVEGQEPTLRTLLAYGIRRMPGEVALPTLYTFPTFAVAVAMPGQPDAGYVGFTTSAVTLICSFFAMLTPVLMPRLSRLFHRAGENAGVRQLLTALPVIAGMLAALPTAVILVFAPVLVHGFLGREFSSAVPILRLGVLAAIPLAMFYAARPTMDTLLEPKFMSRLLIACLALEIVVTAIGTVFLTPPHAAVLGLAAAATALGFDGVGLAAYAVRLPRS